MLSGRYISVEDDLDVLIRQAREIDSEQHYVLRIATLPKNDFA